MGLALGELGLRLLKKSTRGTEFSSLNDLRNRILQGDSTDSGKDEALDSIAANNIRALVNPHPDDSVIFDLRPGLQTTFQKVSVRTNSCGMRGVERSINKPGETYRIALLGDSFTFGWGVEEEESFAVKLEKNLNRLSNFKPRFEVLNFGVPGYSTFQEVAQFKQVGSDFNPDAVLVFFIENDFGLPFYIRDIYRPGGILAATEWARLSWQAADRGIEQQRQQLGKYDANSALRELSDICRERSIPLYLTINPTKDWEKHYKRLWILRKRRDIKFINMRDDFLQLMQGRNIPLEALTLPHDPHPSALRHSMYAEALTPHFMGIIE